MAYLQGTAPFANRGAFPFPSVMLLDVNMPRMNGFEVLTWARSQEMSRRLAIVMLTASAQQRDIDRAYELGANAFVTKPGGTTDLRDFVRALDAFWFGHNRFPSESLA